MAIQYTTNYTSCDNFKHMEIVRDREILQVLASVTLDARSHRVWISFVAAHMAPVFLRPKQFYLSNYIDNKLFFGALACSSRYIGSHHHAIYKVTKGLSNGSSLCIYDSFEMPENYIMNEWLSTN